MRQIPGTHLMAAVLATSALPACARGANVEPRTHAIAIRGFQYAPATVAIQLGDTVVWQNHDVVPHTATAQGKDLDTGNVGPHESGRYVANEKGTYAYGCTFHPTMRGMLVVR